MGNEFDETLKGFKEYLLAPARGRRPEAQAEEDSRRVYVLAREVLGKDAVSVGDFGDLDSHRTLPQKSGSSSLSTNFKSSNNVWPAVIINKISYDSAIHLSDLIFLT